MVTSVEQQEQLAELRRQLEHPDRQAIISANNQQNNNNDTIISGDNAPSIADDGMVIGSGAPPPPGTSNDEMIIGSSAPPPPGMPDAPPMAPGAPPPPGPPPPSFIYGSSGLSITKNPLHHVKKLTPREQEIADAKKHSLPLFPCIPQSDNVLMKKIHWQVIPASEIKNTIWADVVIPKHRTHINNLVPLLSDQLNSDSGIDNTEHNNNDTTKLPVEESKSTSTDIAPLSYSWELDTSQFESTFAQRAAVAMKKRTPKGKQYKIGERRSKKSSGIDSDERHVSSHSDSEDSSADNSRVEIHESDEEQIDEYGNKINRIPRIIQKIELIDPKRSYNVSISLSRFKMSYEQLRDSVMNFDDSILTLEMIDVLCEILPQPDEMSM